MAAKNGLKEVKITEEQIRQERHEHRRKMEHRLFIGAIIAAVFIVAIWAYRMIHTFTDFNVITTAERGDSSTSRFTSFQNHTLEYSNDGISCTGSDGQLIWNQSFEMTSPKVEICNKYMTVYDKGGSSLYIMNEEGIVKNINTSKVITTASIASQGTVAVLSSEDHNSYLDIYDKEGNKLAGGEFYARQGSVPVDIALSYDAQKLAVDLIDITGGTVDTIITFYNFGSVGQNEVNNIVASYTYEDTLIPEVDYVSDSTMIAIADSEAIIFDGGQKPAEKNRISFGAQVSSVFHNNKYIGITYLAGGDELAFRIKVFDLMGATVMDRETDVSYSNIEFLSNNEICVRSDHTVALYTIRGIQKFQYEFEEPLYGFFHSGSSNQYMVFRKGSTQKISLK